MMIRQVSARLRGEEQGVAIVVAVALLAVIATLTTLVLATGVRVDQSTARGRNFVRALNIAESGVERAIARLQGLQGDFSGTITGTTPNGSYTVTVSRNARNRYVIESLGETTPSGAALGVARRIQVQMAPPVTFKNALFSETSVATKNNDNITGDIWANQGVIVEQNNVVTGSITSATGYIQVNNGTTVTGDLWSGGYNASNSRAVWVGTNATVGGDVKASVTAPPDPVTCGGEVGSNFTIKLDGGVSVAGDATTWGSVQGPGSVSGTTTTGLCTTAAPAVAMPVFSYAAVNYPSATLHEFGTPSTASATAVADFHAHLAAQGDRLNGTYYVNQSGTVTQSSRVDITNAVLDGDTTIIANVPILSKGVTGAAGVTDGLFALLSSYQPPTGSVCEVNNDNGDCSIHLGNNFAVSGAFATLVYAPHGSCAVKNNQSSHGSIYCKTIEIKNNQTLVYDSRLDRVVGFGPTTLEVTRWTELTA